MSGPQKFQTPATRAKCPCGSRKPARQPVCRACYQTAPEEVRWWLRNSGKYAVDALLAHARSRALGAQTEIRTSL